MAARPGTAGRPAQAAQGGPGGGGASPGFPAGGGRARLTHTPHLTGGAGTTCAQRDAPGPAGLRASPRRRTEPTPHGGSTRRHRTSGEEPAHACATRPTAHSARIYDYLIGGENHFPADREAGDAMVATRRGSWPRPRSVRRWTWSGRWPSR
ncbi:SAM-dependent methyltransferase [Streptomyces sp. NPDC001381]|uniref:SAM-dependent methyltransferase n=1 Tax=Streptomyces sp. NPDC001381 TaxID=3364567 RepID=UPI0036CD32FB